VKPCRFIGAINSSIICSVENANKDGAKVLEDFWQTLSEKYVPLIVSFRAVHCSNTIFARMIPVPIKKDGKSKI
jgi:hypothetical protein